MKVARTGMIETAPMGGMDTDGSRVGLGLNRAAQTRPYANALTSDRPVDHPAIGSGKTNLTRRPSADLGFAAPRPRGHAKDSDHSGLREAIESDEESKKSTCYLGVMYN